MGGKIVGNRRLIAYSDEIQNNEKQLVLKIISKYNLEVINISRIRSAYKVETSTGNYCLKRLNHGKYKPKNGSLLIEDLAAKGFNLTAKYLKTSDGYFYVKHKKSFFYLMEWIDGEECTLNDLDEVLNCVKLLAKFHLSACNLDTKKYKVRNNLKNWPKIFNSNLTDLDRFKKLIQKKKLKSDFDLNYYNYIDSFYNRGLVALSFLNSSYYYKISKSADENKTICHDSFYYQNIIKKGTDYYIIDLDSIMIDLQINDLGKLIRRIMYKKSYQWDFNKVKQIIEVYNSIKKVSKEELEVMLALIVFPHKFWKLGKKRYLKHKNWSESKFDHKLTKLVRYNELQQKFLEDYLEYLSNY